VDVSNAGYWKDRYRSGEAGWDLGGPCPVFVELLRSFGVAAGPSYNSEDMYHDPNMQARGMYPEVEHPFVGVKPIWALPWRMDSRQQERYWAAPTFGQDTDFVLHDLLGVSEEEIASLREQGVVV